MRLSPGYVGWGREVSERFVVISMRRRGGYIWAEASYSKAGRCVLLVRLMIVSHAKNIARRFSSLLD